MTYLDTSVALAHLLAEDWRPPDGFWNQSIVSSRLLEYELWTRIHARNLGRSHGEMVRVLIGRVALLELYRLCLHARWNPSRCRSRPSMRYTSPRWTFSGAAGRRFGSRPTTRSLDTPQVRWGFRSSRYRRDSSGPFTRA